MIKIAIIDDHPVVWRAVQAATASEPDLQVVAHGESGDDLARIASHRPDVLLLDVRLASDDGLALCGQAVRLMPALRVIVFTAYGTPALLMKALSVGAVGYVLKDSDIPGLVQAIRAVNNRGSFIDARLAAGALGVGRPSEGPVLTPREVEVLSLVVKGATNREIAQRLLVSPHTVKYHIENLKLKMGARRRTDLVRLAAERMLT
jgi:DNA-binding NarL/FixJ family response regulator